MSEPGVVYGEFGCVLELRVITTECPFQVEGKLGETYFYFRERHGWSSFGRGYSFHEAVEAEANSQEARPVRESDTTRNRMGRLTEHLIKALEGEGL